MARTPPPDPGAPRGVRFPTPLHERVTELAASSQRTFSDMVLYLCRRGLEAMDQDERDRGAGERLRRRDRKP